MSVPPLESVEPSALWPVVCSSDNRPECGGPSYGSRIRRAIANGRRKSALPKHDEMAGLKAPCLHTDANQIRFKRKPRLQNGRRPTQDQSWETDWWKNEPIVGRVCDGVAHRTHRIEAIGEGQVPAVVVVAWKLLSGGIA